MLTWKQFLLSQLGMNRGQDPLIAEGSRSRLDMGNQLWSLFSTGLGEMDLVACPECCPFLPIARVLVIRRGDELSRRQDRLSPVLATWVICSKNKGH